MLLTQCLCGIGENVFSVVQGCVVHKDVRWADWIASRCVVVTAGGGGGECV